MTASMRYGDINTLSKRYFVPSETLTGTQKDKKSKLDMSREELQEKVDSYLASGGRIEIQESQGDFHFENGYSDKEGDEFLIGK